MTVEERRQAIVNKYKTILGRNLYSQDASKRCCVYTPFTNGKYYSDCSSSICATYKALGEYNTITNTVGLYNSKLWHDVEVEIKKGQIVDVSKLRVGDILLLAGNDNSRKSSGYVGHVELVAGISGTKVTIYGHGSGTPRSTEMTAYLKKRYNTSASTPLGNRGLIKVRRLIMDEDGRSDDVVPDTIVNGSVVKSGTWNLRAAPDTGAEVIMTVKGGTVVEPYAGDGWSCVRVNGVIGWISNKALED